MATNVLTNAERRFIEGILRLMPNYRFELSGFAKPKRPAADRDGGGAA